MPESTVIARLNSAVDPMRGLAVRSLMMWLDSHEQRQGGLLIMQASWRGRDLVEASYRSENWPQLAS
jgi:hypothetical protein